MSWAVKLNIMFLILFSRGSVAGIEETLVIWGGWFNGIVAEVLVEFTFPKVSWAYAVKL